MYALAVLVLLATLVYFILVKPFQYWSRKNVPQPGFTWHWMENLRGMLQLKTQADVIRSSYEKIPNQRYSGFYQIATPTLYLRDPDLIKQITIKDFDYFIDHNQFLPEDMEPLWTKNLFALKGEKWRNMRSTLSPTFTSSKMRAMFGLMTECADQLVRHFKNENSNTVVVEFKDVFTRFANDVIASTAFGLTSNSLKDRENEFYLMGKEATNFRGFWKNMKFLFMLVSPKLSKLIGIRMFNEEVSSFFRNLVRTNVESREKNGIVRPDMIHLLMEARKGRLKYEEEANQVTNVGFSVVEELVYKKEEKPQKYLFSNDDMTAQALIFFFAGFESVSTLLCFLIYELAVNTDVQERLKEEVDFTLSECEGCLTYEALLKMKYLDMVVSETLRKWPPAIAVDRVCVKPYSIQPCRNGEQPVQLSKGDVVFLPIYGLHRNPDFYPDPDRFDPERFNDQNKSKIYPYSYIPFGAGPRGCIGNRFALLEAKIMVFYLLWNFEIVVVDKSVVPLKIAKNQFNLTCEGGFWFGLKPRSSKWEMKV